MTEKSATDSFAEYDEKMKKEARPNTWIDALGQNDKLRAQVAALPAEIKRQTKMMKDELDLYRNHLRDALEALKQAECGTCDGSGGVEVYAGPTPMDEVVVGWTDPEDECCDDCAGTGRDLK